MNQAEHGLHDLLTERLDAGPTVDEAPDGEWLAQRRRLLAAARAVHAGAAVPCDVALRIPHGVHTPGEWCSAGTG